jgi:hypothetical protein
VWTSELRPPHLAILGRCTWEAPERNGRQKRDARSSRHDRFLFHSREALSLVFFGPAPVAAHLL